MPDLPVSKLTEAGPLRWTRGSRHLVWIQPATLKVRSSVFRVVCGKPEALHVAAKALTLTPPIRACQLCVWIARKRVSGPA